MFIVVKSEFEKSVKIPGFFRLKKCILFHTWSWFLSLTGLSVLFFTKMKTPLPRRVINADPFFLDFLKFVLLRKYEVLKMKLAKTLSWQLACLNTTVNIECKWTLYEKTKKNGSEKFFYDANKKTRFSIATFVFAVSGKKYRYVGVKLT